MTKRLSEIYAPKAQAEKDFVAAHPVKKAPTDKKVGTDDDKLFKATNVKTYDRSPRHGNNPGEDEKAYDGGKSTGVNDQRHVKALAPYTIEDFTENDIDALLDIVAELMGPSLEEAAGIPLKPVPGAEKESPAVDGAAHHTYSKVAVDKAIKNNRTGKIGGREAKAIHGLLKGWRGK